MTTITKNLKGFIAALLCAGLLAGCSSGNNSDSSGSSDAEQSASESAPESNSESATESNGESAPENADSPETIKVVALKGPTAMGMTKLMSDDETEGYPYEFEIKAAVDEISPMAVQGTADIMCVPANLASVLYNKTEGGVKAAAINTLGVLYICENGDTINSVDDLKGKTIYASGKGATPEYALNYILTENGINPESDVTIEWKNEHAECVASLLAAENSAALLPQPFVTTAQTKNEGIKVSLDLTEEWDKLENGSAMITGAVIVRTEFAEQYPEALDEFLAKYAESVDYVNSNVADAAQLVGKYDIVPAAVAEKAIPECNIVCITGGDMKTKLSGYLGVLFEQLPASVGGALPLDDFYYGA